MELKPCPFCGGKLVTTHKMIHKRHQVMCVNCDSRGPIAEDYDFARHDWNTRAEPKEDEGLEFGPTQPAFGRCVACQHTAIPCIGSHVGLFIAPKGE